MSDNEVWRVYFLYSWREQGRLGICNTLIQLLFIDMARQVHNFYRDFTYKDFTRIVMPRLQFLLVSLLSAFFPIAASATPISGAASLPATSSQITFNDAGLTPNEAVTDQFEDEGATFSGLFYSTGFSGRANTDGALLFTFANPASVGIQFGTSVSRAAFALGSNAGSASFSSFLDGVLVESFTASIAGTGLPVADANRQPNVFGFEASLFNEIQFTTAGSTGFSFDNLSFDRVATSVPVPATVVLLGLGLIGLGWSHKKL